MTKGRFSIHDRQENAMDSCKRGEETPSSRTRRGQAAILEQGGALVEVEGSPLAVRDFAARFSHEQDSRRKVPDAAGLVVG